MPIMQARSAPAESLFADLAANAPGATRVVVSRTRAYSPSLLARR